MANKIRDIIEKIKVISVLRDATIQGITHYRLLKQFYGLTDEDLSWIKTEYPELLSESPRSLVLIETIQKKLKDELINELAITLKGYRLVFISIQQLIGKKALGFFRGKPVKDIISTHAIVFSGEPFSWKGPHGTNIALIGPGIYFSNFLTEISRERISYSFPIHGIFISEKFITIGLEKHEYSFPLSEKISIIDLSDKRIYSESSITRKISRILSTHFDALDAFFKVIRRNDIIPENISQIRVLSLLEELPSRLLFTDEYWNSNIETLKKGLPGIMCNPGLNKIEDFFRIMPLEVVKARIIEERDIFMEIGHIAVFQLLT